MSLYKLVNLVEEIPGLGNYFPGYGPPGDHHQTPRLPLHEERVQLLAVLDAVRLYQLGVTAGGPLRSTLVKAAEQLFKHCRANERPMEQLFDLIRGQWPLPPPSARMRLIENTVAQYIIALEAAGSSRSCGGSGPGSADGGNPCSSMLEPVIRVVKWQVEDGGTGTGNDHGGN